MHLFSQKKFQRLPLRVPKVEGRGVMEGGRKGKERGKKIGKGGKEGSKEG